MFICYIYSTLTCVTLIKNVYTKRESLLAYTDRTTAVDFDPEMKLITMFILQKIRI